ncbi:MAG: hypothetical protein JW950_10405 [Deltaproteobacteria bacterium]|nr:hypothetical protein [Deltaproteobacteria bacterium]
MNLALPSQKDEFLNRIIEGLGSTPIDYAEKLAAIKATEKTREPAQAAGVLLLLHFKEAPQTPGEPSGEFYFQLIKRSIRVSQAGDLSCPGGMLHPMMDPFIRLLIGAGLIPIMRGDPLAHARQRGRDTFRIMNLFLANAVRESWEELRLNPCNIAFLGPLPTYSLIMFRRTIFPLVGFVKSQWRFCPNHEVDKVVEIPLRSFYEKESYCRYVIEAATPLKEEEVSPLEVPCLVQRDDQGQEDILWGATLNIIHYFLHVVFGFTLPDLSENRIIKKIIRPDYMKGRPK